MKGAAPSLLPLLRSQFLGEALAWLYLHPDQEFSTIDLARQFGVSASTSSREADRVTGQVWSTSVEWGIYVFSARTWNMHSRAH
jgi:hypothetical protein